MNRTVELLAVDLEQVRAARPDLDDAELVQEALVRGLAAVEAEVDLPREAEPGPGGELRRLRLALAGAVAEAAAFRWALVRGRDRFSRAREDEQRIYEDHPELERDVVPPLKIEARRLRLELRRLEDEARAREIDVDGIEPQIDWSSTISVDSYRRPRFVSNETRRRATVEFFRRLSDR